MIEVFVQKIGVEFAAAIGGALAGLAIYATKRTWGAIVSYRKRKAKHESEMVIPNLVRRDIGVYRNLTELMVQAKADRAFVVQFHNGLYYVNKANQMKMSCTHEIVKDGISREQDNMQDIMISKVPSTIIDLISKPYVRLNTKEQDYYFTQVLRNQGVIKCLMSVMKDDSILEGFVGVSYIDDVTLPNRDDIGKLVAEYASKIGFTLRKGDPDESVA